VPEALYTAMVGRGSGPCFGAKEVGPRDVRCMYSGSHARTVDRETASPALDK